MLFRVPPTFYPLRVSYYLEGGELTKLVRTKRDESFVEGTQRLA